MSHSFNSVLALAIPGGAEIWIIVLIGLLLFGGKKLPDLAQGLGKSLRIFKSEVKRKDDSDDTNPPA
ncbi:MAG: twin-arginine translocase TatA/TatE family subunit [Actinomycetota bacterium]|jgi:sec-independent protein translocase protein TatA